MIYAAGDTYYGEFVTTSASTGAATDATGTPVATANHNGTDDGSFTLTVANVATGRYTITGTIPAYATGDSFSISVTATISGIASVAVISTNRINNVLVPTVLYVKQI